MSEFNMKKTLYDNLERKSQIIDYVKRIPEIPLFSFIDISPTELCNRKCVFCPRVDPDVYPSQSLNISLSLIEKIASELSPLNWHGIVNLCGYGEPLLYPDIVSAVKLLADRGIHTEITTNGDPLTAKLLRQLHIAGLEKLVVSLYDGPEQKRYFTNLAEEADTPTDIMVLRERWGGPEDDYGLMPTNRSGVINLGRENLYSYSPCYYPCYSMTIDWNGDVLLCMQDWHKVVRMGNANAQSLLEIWTCNAYTKYRRMLSEGKRKSLFPCKLCDAHGRRHGEEHAAAWQEWTSGRKKRVSI